MQSRETIAGDSAGGVSRWVPRRRTSISGAGRAIQTLKITTLTNMDLLAFLGVQITTQWKHDTKTEPKVVCRSVDNQ